MTHATHPTGKDLEPGCPRTGIERAPARPLTARQRLALSIAVYYGVTHSIEGSMPSLAKRGLMAKDRRVDGGISRVYWVSTEAGRQLAAQIRAEQVA